MRVVRTSGLRKQGRADQACAAKKKVPAFDAHPMASAQIDFRATGTDSARESFLTRRKRWKCFVRFGLIPVSHGSNVVGERLELAVWPPSQRLDCHLQVVFKPDRVDDMPAIQRMFRYIARFEKRVSGKW